MEAKAAVEMVTLECVAWFNNKRLVSSIGYITTSEAEMAEGAHATSSELSKQLMNCDN